MRSPGAVNPRVVTHPSKHSLSPCQSLSCSWRPRSGTLKLSGTPLPRSRSVITKSRAAREAHSPCRPRRREPARRGRQDPSPRSGTSRFSGAPGSASDLPGRRPASQPRPHPAPQRGAASAPYRRVLPAPPQPPELSKPLVFVFSLRRPQGAGRVTPRGGILSLPQWSWKRVPAPTLRARFLLAASVPLSLAEPGSAVESGTWISASCRDGFGREPR